MPSPTPRAQPFQRTLRALGTRPYRPQSNGKPEHFIKTLLDEWAYVRLYSNPARLQTLDPWVATSNHHRPHTALDGLSPMRVLVTKARGNYT